MKFKVVCVYLLTVLVFSSVSKLNAQSSNNTTVSKETASKVPDGLSVSSAVIITEITESKGAAAENKWIKEHYSSYKLKSQTLTFNNNKPFDVITIIVDEKTEIKLYFNIESFYDK